MEEQKPLESQESILTPKVDITKLFLPGAIVLAGLMVSGTILYTNLSQANLGDAGPGGNENVGQVLTADNFKKWAKELKLDSDAFATCIEDRTYAAEIQKDMQDGVALGVEGTPTFFINGTILVGAQPFSAFKTAIDAALAAPVAAAQVSIDDDPILGNANAPVTIVEFSDFECPFCQRFYSETFSQLKKEYVDTGKVRFVYRDFPLSFHPGAEPAAQAANCANDQGKYWEMHDILFSKQS